MRRDNAWVLGCSCLKLDNWHNAAWLNQQLVVHGRNLTGIDLFYFAVRTGRTKYLRSRS
jgi:hypothetical protein